MRIADVEPPDPFLGGQYDYLEELLIFQRRIPTQRAQLQQEWEKVVTPLNVKAWEWHLESLTDKECTRYLLKGLSEGFRIGFNYQDRVHRSARSNMLSAIQNPQVVEEYIRDERGRGRIVGPVSSGLEGPVWCNSKGPRLRKVKAHPGPVTSRRIECK